ncbi:4'-phosphopantetheinyl transferase superfamily protein [Streptomyces sp. NPDC002740]
MTGHPVQVWWARLEDARSGLRALLDPVEQARYESTVDPAGRGRFLVGCALSRLVLGELLGLPPADVPLRRVCPRCGGPHGKVHLALPPHGPSGAALPPDGSSGTALPPHGPSDTALPPDGSSGTALPPDGPSDTALPPHGPSDTALPPDGSSGTRPVYGFSVTHSGALVGVAVRRGGEVGLDVEESHGDMDVDSAARVALSDPELAALYARPAAERPLAFLRTWTRKEAVLKALGVGLSVPLRELELSPPDKPPTILTWPGRLTTHPRVNLTDLIVDGAHPAALAVTGTGAGVGERAEEAGGVRVTLHDGSELLAAYTR